MNLKFVRQGWKPLLFCLGIWFTTNLSAQPQLYIPAASFAYFDEEAREGHDLTVVFFGGSLTWGDGSSDPERTSFRALLQNYLQKKYPASRFTFCNAAIGDTGSNLGIFRLGRDVLAHKPSLVFLDFTLDDDLNGTVRARLGSYERILRDLFLRGIPVVQIMAGTKEFFGPDWKQLGPPRLRDHLVLGELYHTAIGNSFPLIQNFLRDDTHSREEIWPDGSMYLNDTGHQFIFEAARLGLEQAIRDKRICNLTQPPVFADDYQNRLQFSPLESPLPAGWERVKTLRPDLAATELSNAWLKEVIMARVQRETRVEPIRLNFNGTFVGILGEANEQGLGFKVWIDGESQKFILSPADAVWPTSTIPFGDGTRFFWHEIASQLKPGRHVVEILPVFPEGIDQGELRIESVCVAGADTKTLAYLLRPTPLK